MSTTERGSEWTPQQRRSAWRYLEAGPQMSQNVPPALLGVWVAVDADEWRACPIQGCTTACHAAQPLCRHHFALVPPGKRRAYYDAHVPHPRYWWLHRRPHGPTAEHAVAYVQRLLAP